MRLLKHPIIIISNNTQFPAAMRVKVRFNAESGQPPVVLDLRFLPRIGERISLGFRRVIEVMEVCRVESDNRFGGIVRARFIHEERRMPTPPPMPRPMPFPPAPVRSISTPPPPAPPAPPPPVPAANPIFGDLNLDELSAHTRPSGLTPEPAI